MNFTRPLMRSVQWIDSTPKLVFHGGSRRPAVDLVIDPLIALRTSYPMNMKAPTPCLLGRQGGEGGDDVVSIPSFLRLIAASETGFWCLIWSTCNKLLHLVLISVASYNGLCCSAANCSSRRVALFLSAMMPKRRQVCFRPSVHLFSFLSTSKQQRDPLAKSFVPGEGRSWYADEA